MKLLHTMIRVKDADASLKFYTELLNMKLDKKKRLDDCWLYFLTDEDGTTQLELTYNDETPEGGYELGYKYLYEPFDLNGKGTRIAFVNDPDGYEVELIEKVVW